MARRSLRCSLRAALAVTLVASAHGQCDPHRLLSSSPQSGGRYGHAVALGSDLAVVTAPMEGPEGGLVHVFRRTPAGWSEGWTLRLPDADDSSSGYGAAVDFDATRIAVTADTSLHGTLYVIDLAQPDVVEPLTPIAHQDGAQFGACVAIEGDTVVVGAPLESEVPGGEPRGAVHVFTRDATGTWTETERLMSPLPPFGEGEAFGASVDVQGGWLAVGARDTTDLPDIPQKGGAVHLYRRSPAGWVHTQTLGGATKGGRLGSAVRLDGGRLAVAAPGEGQQTKGRVHLYERPLGSWVQVDVLKDPWAGAFGFARSLDLRGDRLIVGGGAQATVFARGGSAWTAVARLTPSDLRPPYGEGDDYGASVAVDEDGAALVGAPHGTGAAYAYAPGDAPHVRTFCSCGAEEAPCGNPGGWGCAGGSALGAALTACGGTSVSADDLQLAVQFAAPHQIAFVFQGDQETAPLVQGDGLRCVAGNVFRFPVRTLDASGSLREGPGLVAYAAAHFPPGGWIVAGDTRFFQAWYRSPNGPCGAGHNTSDAVAVRFVP